MAAVWVLLALLCVGCGSRSGLAEGLLEPEEEPRLDELRTKGSWLSLARNAEGQAVAAYYGADFEPTARLYDPSSNWSSAEVLAPSQSRDGILSVAASRTARWVLFSNATDSSLGDRVGARRALQNGWEPEILLRTGAFAFDGAIVAGEDGGALAAWLERDSPSMETRLVTVRFAPNGEWTLETTELGPLFAVRNLAAARVDEQWLVGWDEVLEVREAPAGVRTKLAFSSCPKTGPCSLQRVDVPGAPPITRVAWAGQTLTALLMPRNGEPTSTWTLAEASRAPALVEHGKVPGATVGVYEALTGSASGERLAAGPSGPGSLGCASALYVAGGVASKPPSIQTFRAGRGITETAVALSTAGEAAVLWLETAQQPSTDCNQLRNLWLMRRTGLGWGAAALIRSTRAGDSANQLSQLELLVGDDARILLGYTDGHEIRVRWLEP